MTSATTIAALLAVYAAGEGERMSEPKWTKGPWKAKMSDDDDNLFLSGNDDALIIGGCGCCGSPYMGHSAEADISLISAAPDLYDALLALVKANDAVQMVLCNGPEVPGFDPNALGAAQTKVVEAEELARQALAKARGES